MSSQRLPAKELAGFLRLGLFRDRPVFDAARGLYGGLVVPAHIAAYSGDGLWGFLKGVSRPEFFYDPMTYWFLLDPVNWTRGSERGAGLREVRLPVPAKLIRPAFRELFTRYGLLEAVTTLDRAKFAQTLLSVLPAAAIEFQEQGSAAKSTKAVAKYARILGRAIAQDRLRPSRLVAPYLAIGSARQTDLRNQGELNRQTRLHATSDLPLWSILAFADEQGAAPLAADEQQALELDGFDGVGVWVGSLDEHVASAGQLRRYRQLVRSLERPVWLMYSGYFGLLMSRDGVVEISHGVFYTESKKLLGPVGSGPPAERYYIQRLHRFYEPIRAFAILDEVPDFRCACPECGDLEEMRTTALSVRRSAAHRAEWVERLQKHFLHCRKSEIDAVRRTRDETLIQDLQDSLAHVQAVSDAVRRAIRLDAGHLERWLAALAD